MLLCLSAGEVVECPVTGNPRNGRVKYTEGRKVGASIWYVCNMGYTLHGAESRTCLGDMTWSGSEPVCRRESFLHETFAVVWWMKMLQMCDLLSLQALSVPSLRAWEMALWSTPAPPSAPGPHTCAWMALS